MDEITTISIWKMADAASSVASSPQVTPCCETKTREFGLKVPCAPK